MCKYVALYLDLNKIAWHRRDMVIRLIRASLLLIGQYNDYQWGNKKPNLNADELRTPYLTGRGWKTSIKFVNAEQRDVFKNAFPAFAEAAVEASKIISDAVSKENRFNPNKSRVCNVCENMRRPTSFRFPGHPALRNICKFCDTR